ncbi:glycosyltransferase [Candidatus Parcubacteria bacterium]|nr:glycosyltransferase [Candidatus Parcubacteria bacterium]
MFEYMASGNPIVASDLPALREILSDETAVLVKPNDSQSLADGIKQALSDNSRAQKALLESHKYTWDAHAKKVSDFIKTVSPSPNQG